MKNQHKSYNDVCECARISEIVGGIGGGEKSVIFIRYNPDKVYNKKQEIKLETKEKLDILISTIKKELNENYEKFIISTIIL